MRVHDGRVSWAETLDAELTDIFTVQDRIAEDVARQVMPTLARERLDRLAKRHTGNLDAYQLYLKGRFFWKDRSEPDLRKAIVFFERALETDPGYALAYAGLAQCWLVLAVGGFGPPGESAQALLTAASQALELDDSLSDAHLSLASYRLITWDWHGAEEAFRRAIQLNPSNPTARIWYGLFLVANGHLEEGLVQRQRAVELDPVGLQANASLADSYLRVGLYDQTREQLSRTLELDPNFSSAYESLGRYYLGQGMYEEAISAYEKTTASGSLGYAYALAGRQDQARAVLEELEARSREQYVSPLHRVSVYSGLGDKERAFYWLEKAYRERSPGLAGLRITVTLEPLRSDPRFQDLVARMKFPEHANLAQ